MYSTYVFGRRWPVIVDHVNKIIIKISLQGVQLNYLLTGLLKITSGSEIASSPLTDILVFHLVADSHHISSPH